MSSDQNQSFPKLTTKGIDYTLDPNAFSYRTDIPLPEQLLSQILDTLRQQNNLLASIIQGQQTIAELLGKETDSPVINNQLTDWKKRNPRLSKLCRSGNKKLEPMLNSVLDDLLVEIDSLQFSQYELREFTDKYGYQCSHLFFLSNILHQLGS